MPSTNIFSDEIEDALEEIEEAENTRSEGDVSDENFSIFRQVIDRASIPYIFVSADLVADINIKNAKLAPQVTNNQSYYLRESSLEFTGAVDPWVTGVVSIAIEREKGDYRIDPHEIYFSLTSLPWNLFLRAGRFFFDSGRLNTIHQHDWDFTMAPLVHEKLFADEGVSDTGAELSYLMPLPFYQEIKFGVFNGRTFGHTHTEGLPKPHPLYLAKLNNFFELPYNIGMFWALSFLRYNVTDSSEDADYTYGTDLTLKWKRTKLFMLIWSTEIWYRVKERRVEHPSPKEFGFYSYLKYTFFQRYAVGFRFDLYSEPDKLSAKTQTRINPTSFGQSIWVSYKPSEFSYIRLTLERHDLTEVAQDVYIMRIQTDFFLGKHPTHSF